MARPSVAIIGRPNVGKSTLFNRLVGSRIAIEDPTSGVTRDRVLHPVTLEKRTFDLIDTGGIGMVDRQDLSDDVERQIDLALEAADVLIFLLDAREGVMPLDEVVAERLRRLGKPMVLAANKADTDELEHGVPEFAAFGLGEVMALSAHQGRHMKELKASIVELLPPEEPEPTFEGEPTLLAFVGKRNAGKSSMINALAGAPRVIVSDTPGTTRDAVDVFFERDKKNFVAIDTAGLRRRGQMDDAIEFFGQVRSERAVRRADVAVFLIDASQPVSKVDKRLGRLILDEFKPCVIAINKWDLAQKANPNLTVESYHEYLLKEMPGLYYCPVVCTSAHTGQKVWALVDIALDLAVQAANEVTTGELNRVLQDAYGRKRPRSNKGRMWKPYYATQVDTSPPTFLVFCNNPKIVEAQYTRYLAGQFRRGLNFPEVPLKIHYRNSHKGREEG